MVTMVWPMGILVCGFMGFFWMTPWGAPALKRFGGGENSPDLRFGYEPNEMYRLLERYGAAGIAHWRRMLMIDMVFPTVYSTFLVLLTFQWVEWVDASRGWAICGTGFAIIAGASDYSENFLLFRVLNALPRRADRAVRAASVFTRMKLIFVPAALMVPLMYLVFNDLR